MCPPDDGCAVVAVLALDHGVAKITGATEVGPEVTETLVSTGGARERRKETEINWLSVPRVSSISKHSAAALQVVDLVP